MSDPIIPLVANISVACSDEKRLFDALKSALSWNFNSNDGDNPLKTLQLISAKLAMVWIKGASVAESLIAFGSFPISGPLSATFEHPGVKVSSLVEVSVKSKSKVSDGNKIDNLVEILKKKFRGDAEFFRSHLRFVCLFSSPTYAELGFRLIQKIVSDQEKENPGNFIVRHLALKDFKILMCSYEGTTPFSSMCGDLLLRKHSVVELIREKLDFLTEKPLILSVQSSSQDSTSSLEPIFIVCATYFDLRLLSNCPAISLDGVGQIIFRDISEKQHRDVVGAKEESQPRHDLYLFWDLTACPIADGNLHRSVYCSYGELAQLNDNITNILKCTYSKVSSRRLDFTSCGKFLFVPFNVEEVSMALQGYMAEFSRFGFRIVSTPDDVSIGMRMVLEDTVCPIATNSKPVLCFLTGQDPFEKLVSFLKLEQFHDIVLIHNSPTNNNALISLAVKQYPWSEVRRLHTLYPSQVDRLLGGPFANPMAAAPLVPTTAPVEAGGESSRNHASSDWIKRLMTGLKQEGSGPGVRDHQITSATLVDLLSRMNSESVIDFKHMSLGCFFEKLICWGREERDREAAGRNEEVASNPQEGAEGGSYVGPLFGERSTTGEIQSNGGSSKSDNSSCARSTASDARLNTAVRVDLNMKTKKYLLIVRGVNNQAVEKRSRSLNQMIDDTLRTRQTHEMKDWDLKHRAALKDSDCILRQQDIARACVLFHYSGTKVIAEIVALRMYQHNNMLKFLEKLRAREVLWDVPEACIKRYTDVEWEKLRVQFSIYVEILMDKPDSSTVSSRLTALTTAAANVYGKFQPKSGTVMSTLHIWGFGSLMEQALEFILREGFKDAVAQVPAAVATTPATALPMRVLGSQAEFVERTEPPGLSAASATSTSSFLSLKKITVIERKFFGSYSFQDREAGIFFFAYESEFYSFLQQKFSVGIDQVKSGPGNPMKSNTLSRDEAFRNAVLKVSFYGSTQANVTAARAYLDQLNPRNLKRVQVYFPQAHLAKYKEIQNKRSTQCSNLAAVRRDSAANSLTGAVDPLTSKGFINIRIKPLMHSHGLKRMSLPADTTVTICGSTLIPNDAEMRLFAEVEQQFQRIPSEYLTNTVQVPFSHPLKNQLTMKAHREAFMKEHRLVGLKWDEGSRSSGLTGTAKLWAKTDADMNSALNAIYSAEIAMDEGGTGAGVGATSSTREVGQEDHLVDSSSLGFPTNASTYSDPESLASPHLSKSNLASLGTVEKFRSEGCLGMPSRTEHLASQSLIYWPNPSMPLVVSKEPFASQLKSLLDECSQRGLAVVYPYLDPRTNQNIGISITGDRAAVLDRTSPLKAFMDAVGDKIATVTVSLSDQQYNCLVSSENAALDVVQDQAGALIIHDLTQVEHEQSECLIDLRLATVPNPLVDAGLITVKVHNCHAIEAIEVAIISDKTSDEGWTWGANTLLTLVDRGALAALSKTDAARVLNGEVLVNSDPFTSKTILRLMPKYAFGAPAQSKELISAISRGLSVADRYDLKGVAVAAPVDCGGFSDLSDNVIRALTVDAVLDFARTHQPVLSIRRIACIELDHSSSKSVSPQDTAEEDETAALAVGANDPMALAMIKHLEAQKRSSQSVSADLHNFLMSDSGTSSSFMNARESQFVLASANVTLPLTLFPDLDSPFRSLFAKTIVIKGVPKGILLSLELIKGLTLLSE